MLKVKAGNLILFGLSEMNLRKLREGKPIKVSLSELGLTGDVVIFYGETEEKMRNDLAEFIGPDTRYSDTTQKDS